MGIVAVPKFAFPPSWQEAGFGASDKINAADERIAHVFAVTKTGTLDKFEFTAGAAVAVNAASVIRVSFRTVVSATGEPSGVTEQYRDILGSAFSADTWISPGLMTDDGTDTGAKRTVTRGDIIAIVIEYQSFTAGDDIDIRVQASRTQSGRSGSADGFPYNLFQSGGSWDRGLSAGAGYPVFALKYDDGTYGRPIAPGQIPGTTIGLTAAFSAASTPDERGNRFALTVPVRVTGAVVHVSTGPGKVFEVVLTDSDGTTELETVVVDGDQSIGIQTAPLFVPFAAQHVLTIGNTYRLTVRPTTGTVNLLRTIVAATAILASVFNTAWYGTEREDAGAWTDVVTEFYYLSLVVDGLEEGASAAGPPAAGVGSVGRSFVRGMVS